MAYLFILTHSARPDLIRLGHTDGELEQRLTRLDREVAPDRLDVVHLRRLWDADVIERALKIRLARLREDLGRHVYFRVELKHALAQLHEIVAKRGIIAIEPVEGRPLDRRIAREAGLCWNCHLPLGAISEQVKCVGCGLYSEPYSRIGL